MGQARVTGVLSEAAPEWWPLVGPWIGKALDRDGLLGLDDVQQAVAQRDMQLWLVTTGAAPVAACVTEISDYPRARVLSAVAVGGRGARGWIEALDRHLTRYAEAHGCTKFNAPVARRGWRGLARLCGWSEKSTYWKDLDEL
jgi:hypothetical protein